MNLLNKKHFLIFLFFFSSGFAALLYQVVWLKYLNLLFGSTTYATAAVLAAFMFGLSLGSWLVPRISQLYRSSIRSYGLLEIGVGLFAMLFLPVYFWLKVPFGILFDAIGPQTFWYNLFTFLIAFLVLSFPTILMGASLPLLAHFVVREKEVASGIGILYGINTAGAVAGIICSAFILIPVLGLKATIYTGVVINLVVGVICFLWGGYEKENAVPERDKATSREPLLILYAVSGMLAIGYEVLWTRILVLHFGNSVYAYALMLSVFLLGISLGSYAAGKWIDKSPNQTHRFFAWIQILWAFCILLQIWQFSFLSDTLYFFIRQFDRITPASHFSVIFLAAFQILILPTFLSGALFPIMVKNLFTSGIRIEKATSLSYSYNTVGGIFGSIIATFLLIPVFGTQGSLIVFAATNLILGIVVLSLNKSVSKQLLTKIAVITAFAGVALLVQSKIRVLESAGIFRMEGKEKLIGLEEDISATISVEDRESTGGVYRSLSVNGVNVAGSSPSLVSIQKMQGNLPLLLFGTAKKKEVLHIGFGSGGTAYSVSLYPETKITVVELSRSIVRNADANFKSENHGIVNSGKLEFIYFDGRSFLQNTKRTFNIILSDSIHPRFSGNGSLYTKDYYQLVYDRLRSGGVHSQWIPIYSLSQKNLKEILRAFWEVFPQTSIWYINSTINPYIIVIGIKEPAKINIHRIRDFLQFEPVKKDLASIGVTSEYQIMDYYLFGPQGIERLTSDVEPHIDDLLTVEYESSRILSRQHSWLANFQLLLNHKENIAVELGDPQQLDQNLWRQFQEATDYNLRGQLFFIARKFDQAKYYFEQARLKNDADQDPYEYAHLGY